MKKPVIDYREFRFSKLNTSQFSHLYLVLCWPAYFLMYYLTETFIPMKDCNIIHSPLDDIIPFCELFVIPYVLWYLLIASSLIYFLFYNVENFKRLQIFIFSVQVIATIIYIVYPNMQTLRPEAFPRDNFLTDIVANLYKVDTNTGVCPSLHVSVSIAIASAWLKEKSANWIFKTFIVLFAASICLSTVFIKQHSVVDFFVALPMCILVEFAVFGKSYWLPKFKKI